MSALVPATTRTWYEYAEALLTLLDTKLTEDGLAPDRKYVDFGRPALIPNCNQLIVSGWSIGQSNTIGIPSQSGIRHITGAVNLAGFLVTVARACAPVLFDDSGNPSDPDDENLSSEEIFKSLFIVHTAIYNEMKAGSLFEGKARELYLDGGNALETQGQLRAGEYALRAEIYGIIAS